MYTLRQATADDYEFLYRLHKAALGQYIDATWGWHEAWQREYFDRKFNPNERQIIQVDDQDAGVVVVREQDGELYLALIELLPEFQRRGVGTAVIHTLQQRAVARGLPLTLHVLKTNAPARRLYERLGFAITAEEETRHKMTWSP